MLIIIIKLSTDKLQRNFKEYLALITMGEIFRTRLKLDFEGWTLINNILLTYNAFIISKSPHFFSSTTIFTKPWMEAVFLVQSCYGHYCLIKVTRLSFISYHLSNGNVFLILRPFDGIKSCFEKNKDYRKVIYWKSGTGSLISKIELRSR